ncbi:OsmC family protein [Sphingomonas sp.]|uniref:OsmC family protein n=1 Tax=Sphingomonas sp. TaxID=28214 RepID=UPI003B3AB169
MSEYRAVVRWAAADDAAFLSRRYSRAHSWTFDGGAEVAASASPQVVPEPLSDPAGVDPEEALVAALASCHMLFFLDLASRDGLDVRSYVDRAIGRMGTRPDGREAMVEAVLRPEVELAGPAGLERVVGLHERAHALCYIANSVNFPVRVEPSV